MALDQQSGNPDLRCPARHAAAVTTSDSVDLPTVTSAIYVGVAGDVTVNMAGGEQKVLFKAMPIGLYSLQVSRIWATGTAATNIVALWRA